MEHWKIVVYKIDSLHWTIVSSTKYIESTLCQKCFSQNSPACVWEIFKGMYGENLTSNVSISNDSREIVLQILILQSHILCFNCWCIHCKSKVPPYIILLIIGPHACQIWTKLYRSNLQTLELFDKTWFTFLTKH